jgi:DNA-binding transcriptional regulator YdaS (Cro superfamily)
MRKTDPHLALRGAIKRAGNATALAAMLGISSQAVGRWRKVPPLRVLDVERITGVRREWLRPDLYPPRERR